MAYPAYLRKKARTLRHEKQLTIDELAERLAIPRTTIYYWVRDLPIQRDYERMRKAALVASRRNSSGRGSSGRPLMNRDGGSSRNSVAIANSDPAVIRLAVYWLRRLASNRIRFAFQYHEDQDPEKLIAFWCAELGAVPSDFYYQRKSNSGKLNGRVWRCKYGVLSVQTADTMLRSRLEAWMDCVKDQWLESACAGA